MQDNTSRYKNDDHYQSIRDDYMTPPAIYKPLLKFFNRDEFDIDVCCTKHNIPAKQHFTKEIDGLKQNWQGLCFCNPVWKHTNKWLKKGAALVRSGADFIGYYVIPSDRLYVNYMQENIISNPQAAFAILPGKQGYIIPGSEELPPVPSVGTMVCILAANAPEIAAALNNLQIYNTTFFVGKKIKGQSEQLNCLPSSMSEDEQIYNNSENGKIKYMYRATKMAIEKTGLSDAQLSEIAKTAEKGFDGSFLVGDCLLAICREGVADTIIFLGKVKGENN